MQATTEATSSLTSGINAAYRRVSADGETTTETVGSTTERPLTSVAAVSPVSLQERLIDKAIAAAWVVSGLATAYWTDTPKVLMMQHNIDEGSNKPHVFLLQLVVIGIGIQTVLVIYLTVYLPYAKGLTDSSAWTVYCPRVIPTLTAISVASFLLLIRAVWPVWGFLSPVILSMECTSLLFALHFVPSCF